PSHCARPPRSAPRPPPLGAHWAPRGWRSAGVPLHASESRHARAADPGVAPRGDALLRGLRARRRGAAAGDRGRDAALTPRSDRAHEFFTCNLFRAGVSAPLLVLSIPYDATG